MQAPDDRTPPTDDLEPDQKSSARRASLIAMCVIGIAAGVFDVVFITRPILTERVSIMFALLGMIAIACWCHYDAEMRGTRLTVRMRLLILFVSVIGLPLYYWRTRTMRECIVSVFGLWVVLLFAMSYGVGSLFTALLLEFFH